MWVLYYWLFLAWMLILGPRNVCKGIDTVWSGIKGLFVFLLDPLFGISRRAKRRQGRKQAEEEMWERLLTQPPDSIADLLREPGPAGATADSNVPTWGTPAPLRPGEHSGAGDCGCERCEGARSDERHLKYIRRLEKDKRDLEAKYQAAKASATYAAELETKYRSATTEIARLQSAARIPEDLTDLDALMLKAQAWAERHREAEWLSSKWTVVNRLRLSGGEQDVFIEFEALNDDVAEGIARQAMKSQRITFNDGEVADDE